MSERRFDAGRRGDGTMRGDSNDDGGGRALAHGSLVGSACLLLGLGLLGLS